MNLTRYADAEKDDWYAIHIYGVIEPLQKSVEVFKNKNNIFLPTQEYAS